MAGVYRHPGIALWIAFVIFAASGVSARAPCVAKITVLGAITTIESVNKEFRILLIGHRAEKMSRGKFYKGANR